MNYEDFKQLDEEDNHIVWYLQPSNQIRAVVVGLLLCGLGYMFYAGVWVDKYFKCHEETLVVEHSNWEEVAYFSKLTPIRKHESWGRMFVPSDAYNIKCWDEWSWETDSDGNSYIEEWEECDYTVDRYREYKQEVNKDSGPFYKTKYHLPEKHKLERRVTYYSSFYYKGELYTMRSKHNREKGSEIPVRIWSYNNEPRNIQE